MWNFGQINLHTSARFPSHLYVLSESISARAAAGINVANVGDGKFGSSLTVRSGAARLYSRPYFTDNADAGPEGAGVWTVSSGQAPPPECCRAVNGGLQGWAGIALEAAVLLFIVAEIVILGPITFWILAGQ